MSETEAAGANAPAPGSGVGRFVGATRPFARLIARGSVLLMLTLGIYRFWLTTDIRRFLWANTEVAGDGLEYIGTARELLLGFLIAVVILLPINGAIFFAALGLGVIGQITGALALVVLALFSQYALYRARRYRLTRTVFRGLRFYQDGSAWRYAVCALFWWGMTIVTLGLAYPFGQASLERMKMRHTHYGDLPARFEGSGFTLFFRGLPMWLVVVGPFVFGLFLMTVVVDWAATMSVLNSGGSDALARLEGASPGLGSALAIGGLSIIWAVLAAAVLYPAFQAIVLRWWISGVRFGDLAASSGVRVAGVYKIYARFLVQALLFALLAGIAALGVFAVLGVLQSSIGSSEAAEFAITGLLVGGYVIIALAYSALYQIVVKFGMWRLAFDTLQLSGLHVLDRVGARGEASSAVGEGLADALQVGGI